MFENLLTSIGINSLKVDTLVKSEYISPNDSLSGIITLYGGNATQLVNKIELSLVERYDNPDERSQIPVLENELETLILHKNININKEEQRSEEFKFNLPEVSFKRNPDYLILKTRVYIANSVDAYDEDKIFLK